MKRLLVALVALMMIAASGDVVYVKSRKAFLMESPAFGAKRIASAKKGDELVVLEKGNRWYKVKYNDKEGWVSKLVISDDPPMSRISVFKGKEEKVTKGARRRASQLTAAAAARGLADDDRRRAGDDALSNYSDLEKLEELTITEDELLDFLEQGAR